LSATAGMYSVRCFTFQAAIRRGEGPGGCHPQWRRALPNLAYAFCPLA
jgi:hypothetical protein